MHISSKRLGKPILLLTYRFEKAKKWYIFTINATSKVHDRNLLDKVSISTNPTINRLEAIRIAIAVFIKIKTIDTFNDLKILIEMFIY